MTNFSSLEAEISYSLLKKKKKKFCINIIKFHLL